MTDKIYGFDAFIEWLKDHNYPRTVLLSRHDYAIIKNIMLRQPLRIDEGGEYIVWEETKIRPNPPIAINRPDVVDTSDQDIVLGWGEKDKKKGGA